MIVISKIEFVEVEEDYAEFIELVYDELANLPLDTPLEKVEAKKDIVNGRRFQRPTDGTDIIVGIRADPANILGLMYGSWCDMEEALNYYREEVSKLRKVILKAKKASPWTRLKWLFTGVKI